MITINDNKNDNNVNNVNNNNNNNDNDNNDNDNNPMIIIMIMKLDDDNDDANFFLNDIILTIKFHSIKESTVDNIFLKIIMNIISLKFIRILKFIFNFLIIIK